MRKEQKSVGEQEVLVRRNGNGNTPQPLSFLACCRKIGLVKLLRVLFIQSRAPKIFLTNFLLTYNIRAGISLLIRLLAAIRKDPRTAFSLSALLDETNFHFREEAVRTGLMVGLFTSIYKSLLFFFGKVTFYRYLLARNISVDSLDIGSSRNDLKSLDGSTPRLPYDSPLSKLKNHHIKSEPWHSAVAGFVAGFSLQVMDVSWHRSLALYMATRLVQCMYNYNRDHGYFHFWGSDWNHGDSLLFAVASAQIMYAYAMRPETLPISYYRFILNQGPIDEQVLQAVRSSYRVSNVDVKGLLTYILRKAQGNTEIVKRILPYLFDVNPGMIAASGVDLTSITDMLKAFPLKKEINLIPLQALHPYTTNTYYHTFKAFAGVAKLIFPVYLALALVPATVLRYHHFVKAPFTVLTKSVLSAVQSTMFLSLFCGSYQGVIDVQRWILEGKFMSKISVMKTAEEISKVKVRDFKSIYWIAGFLASSTLLLEKKSRRSELALYALPRAVDSLFLIMVDRRLMFNIPKGEILLFCFSMGGIMFYYENHFDMLSPLVAKVLARFLNNDIVFRDHERLEEFNAFEQLDDELSSDDAQVAPPLIKRNETTTSFTGSIIVPV